MKNYIFALGLIIGSTSQASSFNCLSADGTEATLTLKKNYIEWQDYTHSASSKGIYIGKENAQYDAQFGYDVFDLVDYYRNEDSNFLLKLEPIFENQIEFKAVVVYNNDDHDDEATQFLCIGIK